MHVPVSSTQHVMAQLVLERKAEETKTLPHPLICLQHLDKGCGWGYRPASAQHHIRPADQVGLQQCTACKAAVAGRALINDNGSVIHLVTSSHQTSTPLLHRYFTLSGLIPDSSQEMQQGKGSAPHAALPRLNGAFFRPMSTLGIILSPNSSSILCLTSCLSICPCRQAIPARSLMFGDG